MTAATPEGVPFPPGGTSAVGIGQSAAGRSAVVCRTAGLVALASLTVVIGSGVWLLFFYQPRLTSVWIDASQGSRSAIVQSAHLIGSYLSGLALGVWAIATASRHRLRGAVYGIGTMLSFTIALLAGFSLPWDQMALWAVTAGTNISGYSAAIDDTNVKFILLDGTMVSPGTLQRLLAAHLFFGGVCAVAVLLPVLQRLRNRLGGA